MKLVVNTLLGVGMQAIAKTCVLADENAGRNPGVKRDVRNTRVMFLRWTLM